ncbi:MAG: DUF2235 domain-containing protein [Balneolaceae bacterium]|nr:DUF2235 domain-containing protein [Balneolaceae bacterium]
MHKQRLIVLYDGTWNDPQDQTNVYRIARQLHDYDGDVRQTFFYDPGVGTSKWTKFRGGTFGYGLSENLLQGYEWLAKRYREEDEIWIFGFSRGAYTARSLVGLIRKCGLLHIVTPSLLARAEEIYRNKDLHPDSETCENFKTLYSRRPRIHFIGVWDTVGALGIPGTVLSEKDKYSWHDTELSSIVDRAYHAVALDEFRSAYNVSLWTSDDGNMKPKNLDVQQRWFIGAHANVGGGYGTDPLADLSLKWMLDNAEKAGLKFEPFEVNPKAWKTNPVNSFKEFMNGMYAWWKKIWRKGDGRFHRNFSKGIKDRPAVNVSVDDSVWKRWTHPGFKYRPPTLTNADQEPPSEHKIV